MITTRKSLSACRKMAALIFAASLLPLAGMAAAQADTGESAFPLVTNIQQLRRLATAEPRVICSLRFEGTVCAAGSDAYGITVQDGSGAELLAMDLQGQRFSPGDRVKIEAPGCSVTCDGQVLAIGKGAVVDNDGIHPMLRRSGLVYLEPGCHPLRLLWFNAYGQFGLRVSMQGPGLERQPIADAALFRTECDPASGQSNLVNGLDYRCYEGTWVNLLNGFGQSKPCKSGHASNFDLSIRTRAERVGLEFTGYLDVREPGLYTFDTESDDGSRLFVGEAPPRFERRGAIPCPIPRQLIPSQLLGEEEEGFWSQAEGTVSFACEKGAGLELELRAEAGRMVLAIADASGLSPAQLLHRHIRAFGVARGVQSLEGTRVLGLLAVLSGTDISFVEPAVANGAEALPLLTTAEQVKRLKREEAQRGYPVRIRGVVTRAVRGLNYMVVQDATRGVFVRGVPTRTPVVPQFTEYWEIEGNTAPGDFAPVINWRRGQRLGAGRLPEPITATWDQLMNGSLDTEYVEIKGLATAVGTNRLELLLPEGKINLGFLDLEPGTLDRFENCLIRVRGCLFPAWNRQTHRLNVGELNISSASFSIEEPAPLDLFSTPAKKAADLFLFDAGAGAFQKVKVAGQVLCQWRRQWFMADGTNGLRFETRDAQSLASGDLVEVVGIPELAGPSPLLREATARKTGHAVLPEPQLLVPDHWLDAEHDATRVRLDGLLVNRRTEASEDVLEFQAGWRSFVARINNREVLPKPLQLGSRIQLSGVYAAHGGDRALGREIDSFELLLNSAEDLRVLARPPWLTLPRVLVALAVVGVVLLVAMFWALSLRRRVSTQTAIIREKAQREVALEERARIAKDIHDDVGSNLTFIMMLGERSREDLAKPRELAVHTDKIVSYARATVQALDEIVWAINPRNDTMDALVGYLSQYATHFFENTAVRCRLDVPENLSALVLPAEVRHDLFLAVKEALNNVLKHARASEVRVAAVESAGLLQITIEDNGCGFEIPAAVRRGDGLENMRKRMSEIKGEFTLASVPGQGTRINLTLKLDRG